MKIFYNDGEKIESLITVRESGGDREEIFHIVNGSLSTSARDGFNAGKIEKMSEVNRDYDGDRSRVFVWELKRIDFRYAYGNSFMFTALAYSGSSNYDKESPLHYFTDALPIDDPEWYYPPQQPQKFPIMELDVEVFNPSDTQSLEEWLLKNKESWA